MEQSTVKNFENIPDAPRLLGKNIELIQAVLNLDPHCLNYQVEMQPDDALALTSRIGEYNNATEENLTELVKGINAIIPPMHFGEGNPNNGRAHHTFKIGREYSRVLYLAIVKTYLPKDFNYKELINSLNRLAASKEADEYDVIENDTISFTFRMWWD